MKNQILTVISTFMVFLPWTILPLRNNAWALESPTAEIMIICYAVFMIFSGIFTILTYSKGRIRNTLMKICLIINSMYAMAGLAVLGMMLMQKFM